MALCVATNGNHVTPKNQNIAIHYPETMNSLQYSPFQKKYHRQNQQLARSCHNEVNFSKIRPNTGRPESTNRINIAGSLVQPKRRSNFLANTPLRSSLDAQDSEAAELQTNVKSFGAMLDVVYRYSKVFVLKGTVLSIISISLLAVQSLSDLTPSFLLAVLQAVIGGCLANLYVVGSNQLSDIEIDKVNKPYLPLASGEISVKNGILITSLYTILGICLVLSVKSWHLKLAIFLWYAVGTGYSVNLPLLRWKKYPMLVAIGYPLLQGVILPMLFYLHAQTNIHGRTPLLSKHAIFVFGTTLIHWIVMFVFKDIPDIEGDRRNGINTFASKFGPKPVFWTCIWLLEMIYAIAILVGLSSTHLWIRLLMIIGSSILGCIVWRKANLVDLKSKVATESFYLFIWKLYYLEYLLVPFLRF